MSEFESFDQICKSVTESLSRRDSRRDILVGRIREISLAALEAARAKKVDCSDAGTLEVRKLRALCSQWGDHSDARETRGDHLVLVLAGGNEVRALGMVPDLATWDGHNWQRAYGAVRDDLTDHVVRPATVAQLRAVARNLPAVVARILGEAKARAETEAVEAAEEVARLATE